LHPVELTGFHYSGSKRQWHFNRPALPRPEVKALYFLSVVLVRSSRWTGVTRYGALWCPDFPPAASLVSSEPWKGSDDARLALPAIVQWTLLAREDSGNDTNLLATILGAESESEWGEKGMVEEESCFQ